MEQALQRAGQQKESKEQLKHDSDSGQGEESDEPFGCQESMDVRPAVRVSEGKFAGAMAQPGVTERSHCFPEGEMVRSFFL